MKFINPKIDSAFKKIFGSPEHPEILISFLNTLIYEGNPTIESLEVIEIDRTPRASDIEEIYLDVKAKLQDGNFVIIAMQVMNSEVSPQGVFFNAARTYSSQLGPRQGFSMLTPVITLMILDFVLMPDRESYYSCFGFQEISDGFPHPQGEIELAIVELPKFTKELEQLETLREKWVYFIKSARSLTEIPANMGEIPELNRAFQLAIEAE